MDDLRQTRWGRDYLRELETLYYFYLDDERRAELAQMGRIRRAVSVLFWILKSLLMKLSPARRVMLLVALIFGIAGWNAVELGSFVLDFDLRPWGFALLLIVLMQPALRPCSSPSTPSRSEITQTTLASSSAASM